MNPKRDTRAHPDNKDLGVNNKLDYEALVFRNIDKIIFAVAEGNTAAYIRLVENLFRLAHVYMIGDTLFFKNLLHHYKVLTEEYNQLNRQDKEDWKKNVYPISYANFVMTETMAALQRQGLLGRRRVAAHI